MNLLNWLRRKKKVNPLKQTLPGWNGNHYPFPVSDYRRKVYDEKEPEDNNLTSAVISSGIAQDIYNPTSYPSDQDQVNTPDPSPSFDGFGGGDFGGGGSSDSWRNG